MTGEQWFVKSGYENFARLIHKLSIKATDSVEEVASRIEEEAYNVLGAEIDGSELAEIILEEYEDHLEDDDGCDTAELLSGSYFGVDSDVNQNAKLAFQEKQYALSGLLG